MRGEPGKLLRFGGFITRCGFDLISLTLITGCKLRNFNSIFVAGSSRMLVSHFHWIYIQFRHAHAPYI